GQGQVDPAVVSNIQNAYSAGLGTEVYMTPQPNSRKTGAQQLDEAYNYLTSSGIRVVTAWIQVMSPINWSTNTRANVIFINSIVARAKQYGLSVGIYTNYYDWSQITNGAVVGNTKLWYWNVYGSGVAGESQPNFKDFHTFAAWSAPTVKQFAQVESVCGVTVNRDVYAPTSLMTPMGVAEFAKSKQIVVGVMGLRNTTSVRKTDISL
ncbi:copper chaperone of lysine biosynthesis protein, partial [Parelaphostrongylus tenuis]